MRRIGLMLSALCSIVLIPLGSAAFATQAFLGNVEITLPLPKGYCELDQSNPSDGRLLDIVSSVLGGNRLLSMSADCRQLTDWHTGQRPLLANFVQYQTLRAWENGMPAPPAQVLKATCDQLRAQGGSLAKKAGPDVQKRLESAMTSIRFNEQKFIGVLHEDATACYAALLQKIHAETGQDVEQATISGVTTVKGRIVYVYGFAPFAGGTAVPRLLEQVKTVIAALQAANAGGTAGPGANPNANPARTR